MKKSLAKQKAGLPTHRAWANMKQRCLNPLHPRTKDYRERGITVVKKWFKFEEFYKEMGKKPKDTVLFRRNVNKGYSKSNCRWATWKDLQRNKQKNVILTFKGKTQCMGAWVEELNFSKKTLFSRYYAGWSTEKILATPSRSYPKKRKERK